MTEPVNNEWLDEIETCGHNKIELGDGLDRHVKYEKCVEDIDKLGDRLCEHAKQAILSKLESIEQEAYKKGKSDYALEIAQSIEKSFDKMAGKG